MNRLNIDLKTLVVDYSCPRNGSIMYIIFPAYVPVIGRYLYVHLFVGIERKRWKFHYFTGRFCPLYMSFHQKLARSGQESLETETQP